MSISYPQILALCAEIKPLIQKGQVVDFFEVNQRQFILLIEKEATRFSVLLSLQDPFLRFHLSSRPGKICTSSFSRQIGLNLRGQKLLDIRVINQDRIVAFCFEKEQLLIELFPRKPNLYLIDQGHRILASLNPASSPYCFPEKPVLKEQEDLPILNSQELEDQYHLIESQATFSREKSLLRTKIKKKLGQIKKRILQQTKQREILLGWPDLKAEALLLQANLYQLKKGMAQIILTDWMTGEKRNIILNQRLEPHEEVTKRFKQSKKMASGLAQVEKDLNTLQEEAGRWNNRIEALEAITLPKALKIFEKEVFPEGSVREQPQSSLPYLIYTTEAGIQIWVGKNASKNEELTFRLANGLDWWLHVADYAGSHVVIKTRLPDDETVKDACELAIRYSKAKNEARGDVHMTQCKYVSRLGKTGQVQISNYKVIHVRLDEERWKKLKNYSSSLNR